MKGHGEAALSRAETVERNRKQIQELIKKWGYKLQDIFKMEETKLLCGYAPIIKSFTASLMKICRMAPDQGSSDCKHTEVKGKNVRLTYALTSNANGSEKLPPFVIGKAVRLQAFNKKTGEQLGFHYQNNAKAWMTMHLYQDWIEKWD